MARKKLLKPVVVDQETEEVIEAELGTSSVEIDVSNLDTDDDNIEILGKNQQYSLTMYLDPKVEAKYLDKFIKAVERLIRGNEDYKLWLKGLRDTEFYSVDAFMRNVTSTDAEIQLHHYPFNLYTICAVVVNSMLDNNEKVSTFILADKVLELHFNNKIGLVPLTVTMHEIAHLNKLKILRRQIGGAWEDFYNEYNDYFSEFDHTIVAELVERRALSRSEPFLQELGYDKKESTEE